MQKLSGLVLDVYDDKGGAVLRDIFPTESEVPDLIKTAHLLEEQERRALPSEVFALELVDGPVVLRKFACVDPGNTALSVEYFLKTAHKLPEEAQKIAAENLMVACGWYDIDPPEELRKMAGLGGVARIAMAPLVLSDQKKKMDQNLSVARAAGTAVTPGSLAPQHPVLPTK